MINNSIKIDMKKIRKNKSFGPETIIKNIKSVSLKCIRLGRKKMWIRAVPSGGSTTDGNGFEIQTWIKNTIKSIGHAFSRKRKSITERKKA